MLVEIHLVTRCKITRYWLQNVLVAEVTRCENLPVSRCKIRLLLVAEVARGKKLLVTLYEKTLRTNVYLKPIKIGELYIFIMYLQLTENREKFRIQ